MIKGLIIDGGARGHALALAHLRSGADEIMVGPGNKGMEGDFVNAPLYKLGRRHENLRRISIAPTISLKKPETMLLVAEEYMPDFIEVAQDDALAAGAVDLLRERGFKVFGPTKQAAQIEWDKEWARQFMERHNLPRPEYRSFDISEGPQARDFALSMIQKHGKAFFKAVGLYAGKGVIEVKDTEGIVAAHRSLEGMGSAAQRFLVEQGLEGEEFSYYAITDGKSWYPFKSAQDHKRIDSRDRGENTGGMGAYSPALVTQGLENCINNEIIAPTLQGLKKEGRTYQGILYLGGMVCKDSSIKIIEFNSRWGDPEVHAILPDAHNYNPLVMHASQGTLSDVALLTEGKTYVSVVGASAGYPDNPIKGKRIYIDYAALPLGVELLSAGIAVRDGEMYTNGGRVISVVGTGQDTIQARQQALAGMACIAFEDNTLHYRTDIGWRDIERVLKIQKN